VEAGIKLRGALIDFRVEMRRDNGKSHLLNLSFGKGYNITHIFENAIPDGVLRDDKNEQFSGGIPLWWEILKSSIDLWVMHSR